MGRALRHGVNVAALRRRCRGRFAVLPRRLKANQRGNFMSAALARLECVESPGTAHAFAWYLSVQARVYRRFGRRHHRHAHQFGSTAMEILVLQPLVALIAGILILILPRLLNYVVAIYLILIGAAGLLAHLG